jgi:hypothetical protein
MVHIVLEARFMILYSIGRKIAIKKQEIKEKKQESVLFFFLFFCYNIPNERKGALYEWFQ